MKSHSDERVAGEEKEIHPTPLSQSNEATPMVRQLLSDELRDVTGGPIVQNDDR